MSLLRPNAFLAIFLQSARSTALSGPNVPSSYPPTYPFSYAADIEFLYLCTADTSENGFNVFVFISKSIVFTNISVNSPRERILSSPLSEYVSDITSKASKRAYALRFFISAVFSAAYTAAENAVVISIAINASNTFLFINLTFPLL